MNNQFFSINLVKKKAVAKKTSTTKKPSKSSKTKKTGKKRKPKATNDERLDSGIVIVDDDFDVDKSLVNEERKAYLEEARSQEASD